MALWIFRHLELEWSSFIVWRHIDNHHIIAWFWSTMKDIHIHIHAICKTIYVNKIRACIIICAENMTSVLQMVSEVYIKGCSFTLKTSYLPKFRFTSLFLPIHLGSRDCYKTWVMWGCIPMTFWRLIEVEFKTTFNNFFLVVHYIIPPFLASDWNISLRGTHHKSNCLSFSPGCALLVEQVDYQFGRRCWGIHSKDNDTTTHLLFFPSFYYELGGCE